MRFRLAPTPTQEVVLLEPCAHARFVWNLACEQRRHWRPGRASAPSHGEQARQLTEARGEFAWLAAGSQTVQQQALRDFAQAMANFFAGTHRRPTWRKAGRHEGFRIVGRRGRRKDWVEKTSTGLARHFDLIRVEDLKIKNMVRSARGTAATPGVNVRAKARLNRSIHAAGRGPLVRRLEEKAVGRVERIDPAFTSQTCHACGHRDSRNRESQAVFRCRACGHGDHADVNAAKNIAAGRAVTCLSRPTGPGRPPVRGALQPLGGAVNREPQPVLTSA